MPPPAALPSTADHSGTRPVPPADTTGLAWRVFQLAWPVLALNALVLAVDHSDRYLVGNLPMTEADAKQSMMAAQTTAHYVAWFISSYTVLVSVGATAVVARCTGAGDAATANRATHQAIILAGVVGIAGSIGGLTLLRPFVGMIGLEQASADYAITYLRPIFALLPFRVIEVAGVACLIGAGDTRTGLKVQGGIAVVNMALAWTLSRLMGLGFVGVPLGTAVTYLLGCIAVLSVLSRGRAGLRIHPRDFVPDGELIRRLLHVSVPAAADSLSIIGGQMWFLHIVNRLGDTAASAHGIALVWEALGYLSGHAFGTAAMTLVGQNLGARQPLQATRSGWTAFALGCAVMTIMGGCFFALAPGMFWLYCQDPAQAEVAREGVRVLRLIAFAMPALASTMVFTAALRGAGDTRVPVLFTWVGFLDVRIPLAHLLTGPTFDLGLYGAWLAMTADLYVRGAFFLWRFAGGRWQHARV
jgi:putative MATE family efflux protein